MAFTKWSQIRDEQIERIGREEFEAGKEQMLVYHRTTCLLFPHDTTREGGHDRCDRDLAPEA
ncbi:MAG TPA: hypothetical protein VMK13_06695 [Streptosporangiaceae bacterium]|nr:hypothetical protein [Streptosporangiaceae bacterium]